MVICDLLLWIAEGKPLPKYFAYGADYAEGRSCPIAWTAWKQENEFDPTNPGNQYINEANQYLNDVILDTVCDYDVLVRSHSNYTASCPPTRL